jgi:hypothetical protein
MVTPTGMSELPAGSLVLLTLLLFDFGAATSTPSDWVLRAREAHYDHRLFWPSPADSPEVQEAMRISTFFGRMTAVWITFLLVLTVVLISWDSPLVTPLAVGFVGLGYANTFISAAGVRNSIQRIVKRSRDQRLERLRRRISVFEGRFEDLTPQESEHVRGLIDLHNTIRDAPTMPGTSRTLLRAAAPLILPTIMFVITVFGEVSAERFLDAILP